MNLFNQVSRDFRGLLSKPRKFSLLVALTSLVISSSFMTKNIFTNVAHASGTPSCVGFTATTAGTYQCQWPDDGSALTTTVVGVGGAGSPWATGGSGSKVRSTLQFAGGTILNIVVGAGVGEASGPAGSATMYWGNGGNLSSIYNSSTPIVIAGGGGGAGGGGPTSSGLVTGIAGGSAYNSSSPGNGSKGGAPVWALNASGTGGTQSAYGAVGYYSAWTPTTYPTASSSSGPGVGGSAIGSGGYINTGSHGGQGGWGYYSGGSGSAYNAGGAINAGGGGGGSSYSVGTGTVYSDALNGGAISASSASVDGSVSFSGTPVNITFNTNGGTVISSIYGYSGEILSTPVAPTKSGGYTFSGWSSDAAGYNLVTFPYTISQSADFTLYAQYYQTQTLTTSSSATTVKYGKNSSVTLTAYLSTVDGLVTFYYNNKKIYHCVNLQSSSLVATCSWKPTTHGLVVITALATSANNQFLPTAVTAPIYINVPKR